MRLIYTTLSPYSRKVRITVAEKGLAERVNFVHASPFDDADQVRQLNPLGKVPALVLSDGQVLFDSPVICEYLDNVGQGPRLLSAADPERWSVMRWQALADGVLDATFNIACEHRRPPGERSKTWIDRWVGTIERGLDAIEAEVTAFPSRLSMCHVSVAVVPDYIVLRAEPYVDWSKGRPNLASWFAEFSERPSMKATHPSVSHIQS